MLLLLAMGHVLHGAQDGIDDGPELLDLAEPLLPVPGLLEHVVQDARQGRAAGAGPVRSRLPPQTGSASMPGPGAARRHRTRLVQALTKEIHPLSFMPVCWSTYWLATDAMARIAAATGTPISP